MVGKVLAADVDEKRPIFGPPVARRAAENLRVVGNRRRRVARKIRVDEIPRLIREERVALWLIAESRSRRRAHGLRVAALHGSDFRLLRVVARVANEASVAARRRECFRLAALRARVAAADLLERRDALLPPFMHEDVETGGLQRVLQVARRLTTLRLPRRGQLLNVGCVVWTGTDSELRQPLRTLARRGRKDVSEYGISRRLWALRWVGVVERSGEALKKFPDRLVERQRPGLAAWQQVLKDSEK